MYAYSHYKKLMAAGGVCLGALLAPTAHAALMPWTGTANYLAASGSAGDEDNVGPFNSYDFASGGVVLIRPAAAASPGSFTVGDTFDGYYQSYVTRHMLGTSTVSSANLNTTGSGSGYEITVGAHFTEEVTAVDAFGNPTFSVTGGTATVYLDTNPNYNFSTGAGFNDGTPILTGNINGGTGTFLTTAGVGVGTIQVAVDSSGVNSSVFNPADIAGADGIFTLKFDPAGTAQVSAVLGNSVGTNDLVLQADGNLNLLAVPLPAPVWLLGVALAGLAMTARRNSNNNSNGNGALMPMTA